MGVMVRPVVWIAFGWLTPVTAGHAQAVTTAAIYGMVTAAGSAPLDEATVSVTNTANGERWHTVTRADGRYALEYLSLGGPYVIEARAIGFAPRRRTGVVLSLGQRARSDFELTPLVATLPELTVSAVTDRWINAGRTGPSQTITDTLSNRLPVRARDFSQLILLSPQALPTRLGGVSIAGQSERLNSLQIDGATNNDLAGYAGGGGIGAPGQSSGVRTLSVEAVQELQIITAPFDVRYGNFAAGLVNAVTRSGANHFAGSIATYFEGQGLTGRNERGDRAEEFSTRELAMTASGPIVRDRAAFFLDVGVQRDNSAQALPAIGTDTVGGADSAGVGIRNATAVRFQQILRDRYGVEAGSFTAEPTRAPSGNLFAKVTVQPAVNHRIEISQNLAHGDPRLIGHRYPPFDGYYSLSSNFMRTPATIDATRLNWTFTNGRHLFNELVLGRLSVRESQEATSHFSEVAVSADADGAFLLAGQLPNTEQAYSDQHVWELTDNATWTTGAHQFTAGTHAELVQVSRADPSQPTGHWDFGSLDSLEQGLPNHYFRTFSGPMRPGGRLADFRVNQIGFYVQERWAATSRLTLTGGLRIDVPYLPTAPALNPDLLSALGINTSRTPSGRASWSPRFGFNYDVGGVGAAFLRGGVGLFEGRPAYHWFSSVYAFTGLEEFALDCYGGEVPAVTFDPAAQPTTCGAGAFEASPQVNYFSPGFRFPRNLRVALGGDVRLPFGVVGTLDLLYIRGVDQYYVTDVNLVGPVAIAMGEAGRALYGTMDSTNLSQDGFFTTPDRVSERFGSVAETRNSRGDRSVVGTIQLSRHLAGGGEVSLAYTYTDSRDRMSARQDLAQFNLESDALDGTLDGRRVTASAYNVPHRLSLVASVDLPYGVRFGAFYGGFSGFPYTFRVVGDANADGVQSANDPVYVPRDSTDITLADPAQWGELDRLIRSRTCLRSQRGKLVRRNSCHEPWQTLLNLRVSKVVPIIGGQSVELIIDMFNALRFFDRDWGLVRDIDTDRFLELVGYDLARGRGVYHVRPVRTVTINDSARWRLQLGARYAF